MEENKTPPDCDALLEQYMQCVRSKNGLSHADDCPEESWAYKECVEVEHAMGITSQRRKERDATFFERFTEAFWAQFKK